MPKLFLIKFEDQNNQPPPKKIAFFYQNLGLIFLFSLFVGILMILFELLLIPIRLDPLDLNPITNGYLLNAAISLQLAFGLRYLQSGIRNKKRNTLNILLFFAAIFHFLNLSFLRRSHKQLFFVETELFRRWFLYPPGKNKYAED